MSNPYAPPAVTTMAPAAPAPLPEGFRRYQLDPVLYRRVLAQLLRRRRILVVGIAVLYVGSMTLLGIFDVSTALMASALFLVVVVLALLRLRVLARRTEARVLECYELLVSPRVIRRVTLLAPSEMVLAEISSIVDVGGGLSLGTENPPRRLYIPSFLASYADMRARMAAVRPIEPATGFAALRRRMSHLGKEQALVDSSRDPSLREEIALLRAVSRPVPAAYMIKRNRWRLPLLWCLLIVMFLAIWQLLSPPAATRPAPRGRPTMQGQVGESPEDGRGSERANEK